MAGASGRADVAGAGDVDGAVGLGDTDSSERGEVVVGLVGVGLAGAVPGVLVGVVVSPGEVVSVGLVGVVVVVVLSGCLVNTFVRGTQV